MQSLISVHCTILAFIMFLDVLGLRLVLISETLVNLSTSLAPLEVVHHCRLL